MNDTETHPIYGCASVKDRYNAARRKLQRQGRKFAGIRIITSNTVSSDETLPARHRGIKDVIAELEARFNHYHVFTNYNDEVVFKHINVK